MKIMIAAMLGGLFLISSPASADWKDDVFTDLNQSAPRSAFIDATTVEASIFDRLRDTTPVRAPDKVDDAPAGE